MSGKGYYRDRDDNRYLGDFSNNMKHGYGEEIYNDWGWFNGYF